MDLVVTPCEAEESCSSIISIALDPSWQEALVFGALLLAAVLAALLVAQLVRR